MRVGLVGVPLIAVALWSGSAWAQDQAVQERLVQLNKEALVDADTLEWESAKRTLLEALVLAKKGGLDNHPIMARTYVHLGVVYIMGFKDRAKGVRCFIRALEIQSDITLTRAMARTTEVDDAFAQARAERWPVPRPAVPDDGFAEPDLPVRMMPLDCPVPTETRVDQAVPVRCALAPKLPVTKVFLLYRDPVTQRFTEVEMKRTPKGWFRTRIPERVLYGRAVQFYFEGRNAAGKPIINNGREDSPNVIIVLNR